MSTQTELKLLTLLNVTATKRPRELDQPGGHRGSPSVSVAPEDRSEAISSGPGQANGKSNGNGSANAHGVKRRKSVVFGGEVGPSGSTYVEGKRGKKVKVNGKGKERESSTDGHDEGSAAAKGVQGLVNGNGNGHDDVEEEGASDEDDSSATASDHFVTHFGVAPPILSPEAISSATDDDWATERSSLQGYGKAVELRPVKRAMTPSERKTRLIPALATALRSSATSPLVTTSVGHLGSYRDYYLHSLDGEADGSEKVLYGDTKEAMRKAVIVHALNHVLKTRKRIIRNNEKLAHASAAGTPLDPPQDQSFTRPKVLLLFPLRSLALHYLTTHLFPLAPADTQVENLRPFTSSFSIPADSEDPLASSSAVANYPLDHLVNFRGNSDDNFRFGIKITRKAWRVVMMPANETKLMECDILIASPLGMKMAAEREDSVDLLSSIEICVMDGMDVMQMQNWDHIHFIFNSLNQIPKSPHGCDFSRVKPWYLEQQAKYLRQTILLSRYDSPEARSLFHKHCFNLEGKVRLEKNDYTGILDRVRPGVKQVFERFDLENNLKGMSGDAAAEEVDARLEWFTKKTIPALLRSAISRQNTLIIVPSYFDYVRLIDQLRKADNVSFASISEYSSNSEISRARTLFFKGKKSFLILTERFHFYRRYKIRGAKTIVFYSIPEHAQFYTEFLATPFLPAARKQGQEGDVSEMEVEVDEGEVSSRVLFSRFDKLRLERLVGSGDARRMLTSGEARFVFA